LVETDLDRRVGAVGQHLSLGAMAVIGAGLSIGARFPMTGGLNTLLWDSLDADPAAREEVAAQLQRPDGPGKQLVGDAWHDVIVAWKALEGSADARDRFQRQFSKLDNERSGQPSPAHEALARLIHAGVVECVVSLNWDTALERAYERLYGVPLPTAVLFKPHGDAAAPEMPWVLPHEPGRVSSQISEMVDQLASTYARTLLIVGYSERDQFVVENLIDPLDQSWRTVRIGPTAGGVDDVPSSAETVLPRLALPYAEREAESAWHVVTYRGSRDVGSALRGERLSPSDVNACPPLAEVDLLVDALQADRAVVLNGPTGCGKSISAYQALRKLATLGFETLRLRDGARDRGIGSWLVDLRCFPRPKVLLVDDAQDLSPDTVRELAELADAKTLVLVAGIDHVAGGVRTVRLGAGAAVARLARWVRDERISLFALVQGLDDQVGSHPLDIFFDHRIDAAERQKTPWLFFYTLTGGWRRIRRAAIELRDVDRSDLALVAVAVAQIAAVDIGVDRATLLTLAAKVGRNDAWIDASLHELVRRRLVFETDGRFRCAHLQTAYVVLSWMLHPRPLRLPPTARPVVPPIASAVAAAPPSSQGPSAVTPPGHLDLPNADVLADREAACELVSFMLDSPETPLRGLSWLAGGGSFWGTREMLRWKGVLGPERDEKLATRALSTSADGDVAAAAQLLADTIAQSSSKGAVLDTMRAHEYRLREWFATIAPENAWALGNLTNNLHQPDPGLAAQLVSYADTARLASLVTAGGWPHSSSTGHALDRFCNVGSESLREVIRTHLDYQEYTRMFDDGDPEFWRAVTLIADLTSVDHGLALHLLAHCGPHLASQFQTDPVGQWNDMTDLVIRLGYGPRFLRGRKHRPPADVTRAIKAFTGALNRQRIADTLAGPNDRWGQTNFDGFINLLSEADPSVFAEISSLVDMQRFEESLRAAPHRAALYVALFLQDVHADELHAILDRLEPSLETLDPFFVYIAPDVGARAIRRGLPLDLELDHQRWGFAAEVLDRLRADDPAIAAEVARANAETMAIGLAAKNTHGAWEDLRYWTAACDHAAPGLLDEVINGLPAGAVSSWAGGLKRPQKYGTSRRKDIAPLVHRAAKLSGYVMTEATELLRRFPTVAAATTGNQPSGSEIPDSAK